MAYKRKQSVRNTQMQILNDLHVIRWNHDAQIATGLHLTALEPCKTDGEGTAFQGRLKPEQDVRRVSASTDGEGYVTGLHEISKLLGENMLIRPVIGPSGHQRHVVR